MPTTNVCTSLSKQEQTRKSELVSVVKRGMATFVEVGRALQEIRDEKLYRDSHKTFEKFCGEEFEISRPRAYQLIEAAVVVDDLSKKLDKNAPIPERDSQARELASVPPEQQVEVWQEAVQDAEGEQPTVAQVRAAVERIASPPDPPKAKEEPPPVDALGIELPKYLLDTFSGLALFKEADSLCRELQDKLHEIATHKSGSLFIKELQSKGTSDEKIRYRHPSMDQIKRDLKFNRPHTRCPYCASREPGKVFKDCKACYGFGWSAKIGFESAPEDYRKAVQK